VTDSAKFKAGHVFHGPNGQGYALRSDARVGATITSSLFEAIDAAPEPVDGQRMPEWLSKQIVAQ
jgi:hypothetical protein